MEMTTTGLKSCKYCRVIKLGKSGLVKKKVASSKKRRLYSGSNKYAYFLPLLIEGRKSLPCSLGDKIVVAGKPN